MGDGNLRKRIDEINKNYMNLIDYILFNFSEKDLKIYRMRRFENKTLEEVGREFGVTRERIRQIEAKMEEKTAYLKLDTSISKFDRVLNHLEELSERTKNELRNLNLL